MTTFCEVLEKADHKHVLEEPILAAVTELSSSGKPATSEERDSLKKKLAAAVNEFKSNVSHQCWTAKVQSVLRNVMSGQFGCTAEEANVLVE